MTDYPWWFVARARNPERITLEDAFNAGKQSAPSISPTAPRPVIQWLRNGCDPMKAADELAMLAAAPEAKP